MNATAKTNQNNQGGLMKPGNTSFNDWPRRSRKERGGRHEDSKNRSLGRLRSGKTDRQKLWWQTTPVDGRTLVNLLSKFGVGSNEVTGAVLTLPLPPTKNSEPKHWAQVAKLRKHWAELAMQAWNIAGSPRFGKVEVTPIFFVLRRNRDHDNCYGEAFKGLQDGLKGRLVKDDSAKYLVLKEAQFCVQGTPRLELWITVLEEVLR